MRLCTILLTVCLLSVCIAQDVKEDRAIVLAQKAYQVELEKLQKKHEAELREVHQRYLEKLSAIQDMAVEQKQFDRALEIQKVKKQAELAGPPTPNSGAVASISLTDTWQESQEPTGFGPQVNVTQKGNQFAGTASFQHPTAGKIDVAIRGKVDEVGKVEMEFRFVKAPAHWKDQKRTGRLSMDGKSICGYAILEGETKKHWFEWTRN